MAYCSFYTDTQSEGQGLAMWRRLGWVVCKRLFMDKPESARANRCRRTDSDQAPSCLHDAQTAITHRAAFVTMKPPLVRVLRHSQRAIAFNTQCFILGRFMPSTLYFLSRLAVPNI